MKKLTKRDLFLEYNLNDSHSKWDNNIDNWFSVEVYRLMHKGQLPNENDKSIVYVLDFLNRCKNCDAEIMRNPNFGSLYLTAKRMVFAFADIIVKEVNELLTNPIAIVTDKAQNFKEYIKENHYNKDYYKHIYHEEQCYGMRFSNVILLHCSDKMLGYKLEDCARTRMI